MKGGRRARRLSQAASLVLAVGLLTLAGGYSRAVYSPKTQKAKCLGPGDASGRQQELMVPAYFSPSGHPYWNDMIKLNQQAKKVGIAIMNPDSGPGEVKEDEYVDVVARATSSAGKIKVYGYVSTSYGKRSLTCVKEDIDKYREFYGVNNIFLDEVSSSLHRDEDKKDNVRIDYYKEVARYIHAASGASVILNPGVFPAKEYMDVGDIVVVFESFAKTYQGVSDAEFQKGWLCDYGAEKYAHLIHDAKGSDLKKLMSLTKARHAGYVYVTDDSPKDNKDPWDTLPGYMADEAGELAGKCAAP